MRALVALAAGAFAALATPPTDLTPTAFVGFAVFALVLERGVTPGGTKSQLVVGLAFGTGANAVALRFVPQVIQRFTDMGPGLAYLALFLLAVAQSLGWALAGAVHHALRKRNVGFLLSYALAVYAFTFFPCIFPWTPAGGLSSLFHWVQIADIVGERGTTLLFALFSGALGASALALGQKRWADARTPVAVAVGTAALMVSYGYLRVRSVDARRSAAPTMTIGLVQPGIEAKERWEAGRAEAILAKLTEITKTAEKRGAELVVWPESAYPYTIFHSARRAPTGARAMLQPGVRGPVLSGIYTSSGPGHSYNSASIAYADGSLSEPYDKRHLLWFGETVPLADELPWLRKAFRRGTGLEPGDHQVLLTSGPMRAGVLNCYEDTIGKAGREAQEGANLLVNVTNDGWFVGSAESELHLRLSVMRSIEVRKDMVRAVNLGPTSWIDAAGRVRSRYADPFPAPILVRPALLDGGETFFARFGDWPTALLGVGSALGAAVRAARRRRG